MYRNHRQDIAALMAEDGRLREGIAHATDRLREIEPLRANLIHGIQSACPHETAYEFRLLLSHKGRCLDRNMRVCLECRLIESEADPPQGGFARLKTAVRRRNAPMTVEQYRELQLRIFEEDALDA